MAIDISADIKKDANIINGDIPGQVVVGLPGPPGISPHIGSNGNWFIGENDTGVPATGPASPPIPGGKAGQYLRKKSDANGDVEWADGGGAESVTINGQRPDAAGNFIINTVSDVEIAQLNAALT